VAVELLVLKLVLTPLLIAGASLAGRRWGHAVSGWLVGLPLTSGPVAFFLAIERGESFAGAAALGALAGAIAEAAFCVPYAWVARTASWGPSLLAASAAFAVTGALLQWSALSLVPAAIATAVSLKLALAFLPGRLTTAPVPGPPAWDLPARMIVATALVLGITEGAPVFGPRLSGILATFPVYAAILTVFAHRANAGAGLQVLRGLLMGLFAFGAFFVTLAVSIEPAGIAAAFVLAGAGALAVQGASFAALRLARQA
jgi:hypothetical protein